MVAQRLAATATGDYVLGSMIGLTPGWAQPDGGSYVYQMCTQADPLAIRVSRAIGTGFALQLGTRWVDTHQIRGFVFTLQLGDMVQRPNKLRPPSSQTRHASNRVMQRLCPVADVCGTRQDNYRVLISTRRGVRSACPHTMNPEAADFARPRLRALVARRCAASASGCKARANRHAPLAGRTQTRADAASSHNHRPPPGLMPSHTQSIRTTVGGEDGYIRTA